MTWTNAPTDCLRPGDGHRHIVRDRHRGPAALSGSLRSPKTIAVAGHACAHAVCSEPSAIGFPSAGDRDENGRCANRKTAPMFPIVNLRVQKIVGKRVVSGLGAGGRWSCHADLSAGRFESIRPDHF